MLNRTKKFKSLSESLIIFRLPYNAHQQKQRMEERGNQQLFPVMDSLNQLGSIPWMVNKPMLDLLIEVSESSGYLSILFADTCLQFF